MDLKEIDILGTAIDDHWYYYSKARALGHFLNGMFPSKILDVGAGSGFFSRYLLKNSSATEAWCVDIGYASNFEIVERGKTLYFRNYIDSIQADLVLFIDVLEHLDDDIGLLKTYVAKVPPGSQFLISVPAFQFLWSGHDDFLDHKRRYTLPLIEKVVRTAGLRVKHSNYYFGMVFPIAAATRLAQKFLWRKSPPHSQLTRHHLLVNSTLKALCSAELPFMTLNRFAGLTVFCLAKTI